MIFNHLLPENARRFIIKVVWKRTILIYRKREDFNLWQTKTINALMKGALARLETTRNTAARNARRQRNRTWPKLLVIAGIRDVLKFWINKKKERLRIIFERSLSFFALAKISRACHFSLDRIILNPWIRPLILTFTGSKPQVILLFSLISINSV